MNAPAPVKEAEPLHDLAWWAAERTGTDWRAILLTVMRSLGIVAPCDICEREPCQTPSFCQACREADQGKTRREVSILGLQARLKPRPRPTPQATIEAVKQAVRNGGIAALKEPNTRERLARCDVAAQAEIDKWLTRFKAKAALHPEF
jgi:hypothetical protein